MLTLKTKSRGVISMHHLHFRHFWLERSANAVASQKVKFCIRPYILTLRPGDLRIFELGSMAFSRDWNEDQTSVKRPFWSKNNRRLNSLGRS